MEFPVLNCPNRVLCLAGFKLAKLASRNCSWRRGSLACRRSAEATNTVHKYSRCQCRRGTLLASTCPKYGETGLGARLAPKLVSHSFAHSAAATRRRTKMGSPTCYIYSIYIIYCSLFSRIHQPFFPTRGTLNKFCRHLGEFSLSVKLRLEGAS